MGSTPRIPQWDSGGTPHMGPEVKPVVENDLRAFHKAKMSSQDMQLNTTSCNQIK